MDPAAPQAFAAVAGGGALGAAARHGLVLALARSERLAPFGVLAVNLVGCFAIGALWAWLDRMGTEAAWLRPLLMTGFLGGFTTYSAFGKETVEALAAGRTGFAVLNVSLHVGLGLAAVALGRAWLAAPVG